MSDSFGPQALHLYSIAARLLGWRPDHFWSATPAELVSALAPIKGAPGDPLARADLEKMMEIDNG